MTNVLSHPAAIKDGWVAMATKRVNWIGRHDSNGVYGGYGWDEGWQRALSVIAGFPMWGSGIQTRNQWDDVNQVVASTEMGYQIAATGGAFLAASGAPAALHKYFNWPLPAVVTHRYSYLAAGVPTAPWGQAVQMLVANAAIGPASRLRCHQQVGLFPAATGRYLNVMRMEDAGAGYPEIARDVAQRVLGSSGATEETREDFFDVHGLSGRTTPLGWRLTAFAEQLIVAAAWFGWFSVENRDRPAGYRWSNQITAAGQSLYEFVLGLRSTTGGGAINLEPALSDFYRRVADQPNQEHADDGSTPIFIFVTSGANDPNRSQLSLGPSPAETRTADGFFDNLMAMAADDEAAFTAAGVDPNRRRYVVQVTHPAKTAKESILSSYHEAATDFCAQIGIGTTASVRAITTSAEMLANNWYNLNGSDENHLASAGYQVIAERLVSGAKTQIEALPSAASPTPTQTGYLSPFEADDLIVKVLPAGTRLRAAWDNAPTATREAAIAMATRDIDAIRYDGVPVSDTQPFEWPRQQSATRTQLVGRDPYRSGFEHVLDLPYEIRLACAIQSAHRCSRFAGLDPTRAIEEATRRGVLSQGGGGQTESYDLRTANSSWAVLVVEAQGLLNRFRLSGGSFV